MSSWPAMMCRMAHLSLVPSLGDEEPPTEPDAVSTLGDLFGSLRAHLWAGDDASLDLRLAEYEQRFADTPLPGND